MKMKCGNCSEVTHKDVVIIGNGPSGIAMSYMLSGNRPYVVSGQHPDEFLSARLSSCVGQSLVSQDLGHLASGLEGRTTNPVSLLLDSLMQPYADIGLDLEPLVEWRNDGPKIEHVVLGKGPPGGSWHTMDPQILTLSLGSWMSLPGLRYEPRDGSEKRASAKHVAEYYVRYVQEMGLQENFENGVIVTRIRPCCGPSSTCNSIPEGGCTKGKWVEKVNSDICQKVKLCSRPEPKEKARRKCALANAFNYLLSRSSATTTSSSAEDDLVTYRDRSKSCDSLRVPNFNNSSCSSTSSSNNNNNSSTMMICDRKRSPKWFVEYFDLKTRTVRAYSCDNLVLANGSSDMPNRLSVEQADPYWLLHDTRSLEIELDLYIRESRNETVDPVVIVGAGLSAADAIIATRSKGIPVAHVFRGTSTNLSRQLPENMYPEYHKVHQMMKEDSTYPLYDALPEHSLIGFDEVRRLVRLRSNDGKIVDLKVSFVAVLIGSKPDLSFLPDAYNIATKKHLPLDCKRNTVNIDRMRHSVHGFDGLYAMGPLAGDNFVRFLPGGALAILSDLHRKRRDAIVK